MPLLLLYIKTNCSRGKLKGSKQLFKGCEKALAASEFKTDCFTLIWFSYYFLAHHFLTILGGDQVPLPSPCYGPELEDTYILLIPQFKASKSFGLPNTRTSFSSDLTMNLKLE